MNKHIRTWKLVIGLIKESIIRDEEAEPEVYKVLSFAQDNLIKSLEEFIAREAI